MIVAGEAADNDNSQYSEEANSMRIYVFTSESKENLRAFTNDISGKSLPQQFAPWRANGPVAPDDEFPFRFARDDIEKAIDVSGFQLWRLKQKDKDDKDDKDKDDWE